MEEMQMSNSLFNALGGGMPQGNGPMQMIQQFMQFKQNFKGDPKAEVEKILQSGQISQQQLNQVQQMARQFQNLLKNMK
jgi:hypothetical protein